MNSSDRISAHGRARGTGRLNGRGLRAALQVKVVVGLVLLLAIASAEPVLAQGAGPAYRIGTDDILTVSVWDQKELEQTVFVRPDGKISLALVGEVEAGGLTVAELASRLTSLYAQTVRGAQVTVSVREIRSRPIFFIGGVARPGPMQLTQDFTLLQALSAAGGALPTADLESAWVLRGKERKAVNIAMMIQKGDIAQNIRLQPGDTIVIPSADTVYIHGEVKAPGQVKFTRDLTIVTAIAAAGGFTPLAAPGRVNILRGDGAKRQVLKVDVKDIMSDPAATPDVPLKPNDVIVVPQRLF